MSERKPSCATGATSMHPLRVRLGEVCKEVSIRNKDGRIKAVFSVTNSKGFVPSTDYFNKEVFSKNLATYKIVECGMFAYNPSRINVGSIGCYNDTDPVVVSPLYVVFSVDETQVDHSYLLSFLKGDFALAQVKNLTSGSVRDSLKFSAFCQILIHLPSLAKQRQIAARIDNISKIVTKRKAQLAQLQQLVKSRFVEMFGDVLSPSGEFKFVKMADVSTVGSSKRIFQEEYVSEGIPFYRTKEIVELSHGKPLSVELFISRARYNEIKSRYGVSMKGDLLVSAVGTIGEIWIVDGAREFYFKDGNLMQIRPGEKLDPVYLRHCLKTLIQHFKAMIPSGTAYAALTIDSVKKMKLPLLPLSLQREFAAFVAKVDRLEAAVKRGLAAAERLYRQQLQEVFGEGVAETTKAAKTTETAETTETAKATETTETTETAKTTKTANGRGLLSQQPQGAQRSQQPYPYPRLQPH